MYALSPILSRVPALAVSCLGTLPVLLLENAK